MKTTYSLNMYGVGPFPRFTEGYKTLAQAQTLARQALADGFHTVNILSDKPVKSGYIVREVIQTLEA